MVLSSAVQAAFSDCADFEARGIYLAGERRHELKFCFLDGLVSGADIGRFVLMQVGDRERFGAFVSEKAALERIQGGLAANYTVRSRETAEDVINDMVNGCCALFFDREGKALTFEVKSDVRRQVSEPLGEKVVKGAKDAFVETIRMNTALVRKKIRSPALKIEETYVGERSGTRVAVLYIEGLTDPEFKTEILRRLAETRIDGLITPAAFEEYIAEGAKSPFPLYINTERADRLCSHLLGGHVGVLIDGLPLGYILPATLPQLMRSPEDRAEHFIMASAVLILRWLSLFITLLLPAIYVAVAMYHQEMLPTKLMMAIIQSKQSVPFSTAAEVLGMLAAFELLQEAGLRLPRPSGDTVSIIGALIVGQSAVEAKVVSPVVVIVVAVAGVTGYTMPSQDLGSALRLCRFVLAAAAVAAGFFGLMTAGVLLVMHLSSLEILGTPYLSPLPHGGAADALRAVLRFPLRADKYREAFLRPLDRRNQK